MDNRIVRSGCKHLCATGRRESLMIPTIAKAVSLLEAQRNALLMYTSCGWFFNDISGIETTQLMKYAARADRARRR